MKDFVRLLSKTVKKLHFGRCLICTRLGAKAQFVRVTTIGHNRAASSPTGRAACSQQKLFPVQAGAWSFYIF
jgi:hypothetical protein